MRGKDETSTFTRDRICSDPFGIGSTMERYGSISDHLHKWTHLVPDPIRTGSTQQLIKRKLLGSVYTGPDPFRTCTKLAGGSGTDRICCLVPNVSTFEGDPIWNRTVPVSNRSRVNRVDPNHSGSDPKQI